MTDRAEFTPGTKNLIAKSAGYRCCNPTCRKNVFIDGNLIGQIAHIIAASPHGPRASKNFHNDKTIIKGKDNGILLCHNCAVLVDRNEVVYTVELLKDWKVKSEQIAYFQTAKSTILKELHKIEKAVLTSDHNVTNISKHNDDLTSEMESLRREVSSLKGELENRTNEIVLLRKELAIKDQYIVNIIKAQRSQS
jgi:hypothetical protein